MRISTTIPPDMLASVQALAAAEQLSMSDLLRQALRRYTFEKSLQQLQNSDSAKATRARFSSDPEVAEQEIVAIVKEVRKTLWPEYKKRQSCAT